jgi:hypothetical protein
MKTPCIGLVAYGTQLRLDIHGIGKDNHMYNKRWLGDHWSDYLDLGDHFNSAPVAVSGGVLAYDIFALNRHNKMVHKAWNDNTKFSPPGTEWHELEGKFRSPPAVLAMGTKLDVFAIGMDSRMYHALLPDGPISPPDWKPLPGATFSSPPAVVNSGRVDVVALGTNGRILHNFSTHTEDINSWNGWTQIGEEVFSTISCLLGTKQNRCRCVG